MDRDSAVQQIGVREGVRCRDEAIGVCLVMSGENRIGLAMFRMTPVTVGVPPARAANEAAVITEAAIGLASRTIDPFTRALISGIGRRRTNRRPSCKRHR